MAYETFIESFEESNAPPSQPLLSLAYTGPGNGQDGVVHLNIVTVEETFEDRTYTILEQITVSADEFIRAVYALGFVDVLQVSGTNWADQGV